MFLATHSSILAWKTPWTKEPAWATICGVTKESDTTERLSNSKASFWLSVVAEQVIFRFSDFRRDAVIVSVAEESRSRLAGRFWIRRCPEVAVELSWSCKSLEASCVRLGRICFQQVLTLLASLLLFFNQLLDGNHL